MAIKMEEKPKTAYKRGEERKQLVTLRLEPAIVAFFKAKGKGWQAEINDQLRKALPAS